MIGSQLIFPTAEEAAYPVLLRKRVVALLLSYAFFFRSSSLSFRQVDQHAVACSWLINAISNYVHSWDKSEPRIGAGEGPDTQSNEVITVPIKSKEPNKSKTNKNNNKTNNHKNKNQTNKNKPTRKAK